jgi:hypothetical protein
MRCIAVAWSICVALGQAPQGTVQGLVRDSVSGAPVAGVTVQLAGIRAVSPASGIRKSLSGPGGDFHFEALPQGSYSISLAKRGYVDSAYVDGPSPIIRVGTEPERVTVDLVPTGAIEGRVLDEDGNPLKGVLIYAVRDGAASVLAIAEAGGQYRLDYLAPGTYRIEIRVPYALRRETAAKDADSGELRGYANTQFYPGAEETKQAAPLPVAAGAMLSGFDLRLKRVPLVELSGSAVNADGNEVELAPVRAGLADATYERRPVRAGGRFAFDFIQPGRYKLLFYPGAGKEELPYADVVEVGRGGLRDHLVKIPAPVRLAGHVVAPEGKAAEWGGVVVSISGDGKREVQPGASGEFVFERVPPGRWIVGVRPAGGRSRPWYVASIRAGDRELEKGELAIAEADNTPLEVLLSGNGAQVSGVLTGLQQEAFVVAIQANGEIAYQRVASDGTFLIPGLAPGEYEISAVPVKDSFEWLRGARRTCGRQTVQVRLGADERRVLRLESCGHQ